MIAGVNLIPAQRRLARAARTRVRAWTAVCTGVALGLISAYTSLSSVESGDRARLERVVAAVGRRAESLEREVAEAKAKTGDAARRLGITRTMVDHPDWSVLLDLLSETRNGQVMLERITLKSVDVPKEVKPPRAAGAAVPAPTVEAYLVRITGLGATQADVMKYVGALEATGLFDTVKPPDTRSRTVLDRDLVGFEFECEISARPLENPGKTRGGQ